MFESPELQGLVFHMQGVNLIFFALYLYLLLVSAFEHYRRLNDVTPVELNSVDGTPWIGIVHYDGKDNVSLVVYQTSVDVHATFAEFTTDSPISILEHWRRAIRNEGLYRNSVIVTEKL